MKLLHEAEQERLQYLTRRHFLKASALGLGALAFETLLGCGATPTRNVRQPLALQPPHFVPKAKRVIYLHMEGAPSQLELFDHKPALHKLDGQDCPQSLLAGRRFAFIQGVPKMLGPRATFAQYGANGTFVSEHLPHFAKVIDEVTLLKAMHTEQFNHAPAQLLLYTGAARLGRPSMGAWVTYGLGSENENLPGFVVLVSGGKVPSAGKSVWGSGFLPSVYQGVQCRSKGEPVLYTTNPPGMNRDLRARSIAAINEINREQYESVGDPEILTRVAQYEMAFRMQMSVPEAMDILQEPPAMHQLYGTRPGEATFANNCLLARRLAERGVRFIQLFHWGWDAHGASKDEALNYGFKDRCREVDQAMSALLLDLKQRGLLEDTLVVWGGEFGRTPMRENRDGKVMQYEGRDHHTEAFTIWLAGGGIKSGFSFGETDDIGYYGVRDRVHVHDLQATILHQLGLDHTKLTYPFQGRDFRLTDVSGRVVEEILA